MKMLYLLVVTLLSFPLLVFTQNEADETPILTLTVAGQTCGIEIITLDNPEVTPEPDVDEAMTYPIISLAEDCDTLIPQLVVSSNGTLWLAIEQPEEEDWQQFQVLEDDEFPPQLDKRGRYIGCVNPNEGEQVCSVLWTLDEEIYQIDIPIYVGSAYIAPTSTAQATTTPVPQQTGQAPSNQQVDEPTAMPTKDKDKKKNNDDDKPPPPPPPPVED